MSLGPRGPNFQAFIWSTRLILLCYYILLRSYCYKINHITFMVLAHQLVARLKALFPALGSITRVATTASDLSDLPLWWVTSLLVYSTQT